MKKFGLLIILCFLSFSLFSQGTGGYCLYYDRNNDEYLELPDITQLNGVSAFTISFWINQDNSNVLERFFYKINGTTGHIDEDISIASYNGNFYFEVGNGANSYGYCSSTISTGTWFHVAAVYDGTLAASDRIKLYIDGNPQSLTISGAIPATTFNFSGISEYVSYPYENSGMGSEYFGGYLDELRIWDYARSQTQINDDMYTPLSGTESGLVAYWKFDENDGQTAFDETSNNYHGTLGSTTGVDVNDPSWFESDAPLPVTLSSFTAIYANSTPILYWTTQSENSNLGWNVYRSFSQNLGQASQINYELIPGAGTTSEPTDYQFTDEYDVIVGQTYWYWLESISGAGETENYGPVTLTVPEEEPVPVLPQNTFLCSNYPNPFNPDTKIEFSIKEDENGSLTIYNFKGQLLETHQYEAGEHEIAWDATQYGSGIYFYKLETQSYTETRKMLMLK